MDINPRNRFKYWWQRFPVFTTSRCNFNCPHCLQQMFDKNKTVNSDLPLPVFKQCLEGFSKINYGHVAFTGGEPILHPEFEKLVSAAVKAGYTFNVVSNGWLYRDYFPVLDKCRLQLTRMCFSLDGSTAAIHDRIRNKPGSYDKVMEGIEFYKSKGFGVWVTTCFNQLNVPDFDNIRRLMSSLAVDDWAILGVDDILARRDSQADFYSRNYNLSDQDRDCLKLEFLRAKNEYPESDFQPRLHLYLGSSSNPKIDFCRNFRFLEPAIQPDGTMAFCCDIYKECAGRPGIEKDGFWPAFKMTFLALQKLKLQRLKDIKEGNFFDGFNSCNYCNRYIEEIVADINENRRKYLSDY